LLVLDLVRIELEGLIEAVDRFTVPVAVEVAEAEVVDRLLVLRVELDRALEILDGALQLAFVVEDRSEQEVGLRNRFDLHGLLKELLRAKELALARVDRTEREVRQERVLGDLDRAPQPSLGAFEVLPLVQQDAVEHSGVEMIRLDFERALQVVLGAIEIAVVEEHLAEEEAQLVVVAVELERLLQRLDAPLRIERVDRRLRVGEQLLEPIAFLPAEERNDPILPLHEALFLFQSEHLLAHLRFPQLDELVGGDDVLFLEQLFDRQEAGLIDED